MIPNGPCATLDDACCTNLFDIATHLLAETYDALLECQPPPDCCPPLQAYVTMGTGDDGVVDTLSVAVRDVQPSTPRPGQLTIYRAFFDVRLRESGWPVTHNDGNKISLPDISAQIAASKFIFSRGEVMHRRLAYMASSRSLVPNGVRCTNGVIGTMSALPPLGGVVGWSIPVTVDMPWN